MCQAQIPKNPLNEVVLEYTFDYLVEEIWRKELMDVRTRKKRCERLPNTLLVKGGQDESVIHT